VIVWLAGQAYEHAREAGACRPAINCRRRGRGHSFAVEVEDVRSLVEWFRIEAEFWSGPEVDPGSRWRALALRRTARRLELQLPGASKRITP